MENTLKKNDELEVEILRLGANGEGIAEFSGAVIFVRGALAGERVLVHIIKVPATRSFLNSSSFS